MREFSDIEIKLLKWVVIPVVTLAILFYAYQFYDGHRICEQLREDRGYLEYDYFPSRMGITDECILRKKILPDGTIDEDAILRIPLDEKCKEAYR